MELLACGLGDCTPFDLIDTVSGGFFAGGGGGFRFRFTSSRREKDIFFVYD